MAPVPFTDREMQRAWRTNLEASMHSSRSNAHRLLLFYSIECGLKAVLMKRQSINCTNLCHEIREAQHNINKLLDYLSAGQLLKLPVQLQMDSIKIRGNEIERKLDAGKINQVWRYGGYFVHSDNRSSTLNTTEDDSIENKLMRISEWIKQELNA
ncbi:hypothetical protein [Vacuolonema iberomarrocanum]|uniref:hypothetical protein n=1 Tax=Vacuolonema iberomarrocanum TaxID=3454632 RepID=UPI0019E8BD28|nr:hypothetical protein [filamentous cyanobacterium LEGE 07170]